MQKPKSSTHINNGTPSLNGESFPNVKPRKSVGETEGENPSLKTEQCENTKDFESEVEENSDEDGEIRRNYPEVFADLRNWSKQDLKRSWKRLNEKEKILEKILDSNDCKQTKEEIRIVWKAKDRILRSMYVLAL